MSDSSPDNVDVEGGGNNKLQMNGGVCVCVCVCVIPVVGKCEQDQEKTSGVRPPGEA